MRDDWVDAFVISGTVDECRSELSAWQPTDEFQVSVNDLDSAAEDLALAAETTRPPSCESRPLPARLSDGPSSGSSITW